MCNYACMQVKVPHLFAVFFISKAVSLCQLWTVVILIIASVALCRDHAFTESTALGISIYNIEIKMSSFYSETVNIRKGIIAFLQISPCL